MKDEISIATLKDMKSCKDGQTTFVNTFGDSSVPLSIAFQKLPQKDVIWFVVHGIYTGHCPIEIKNLIPVDYHPTRKNRAVLWLNKNYNLFIESVLRLYSSQG